MSGMSKEKTIVFDIETLPDLEQILKHFPRIDDWPGNSFKATLSSVLCIAYKDLNEKKVHIIKAWDYPEWNDSVNSDIPVLEAFRKVVESATGLVSHNGKKFDYKFLQTRYLIRNLAKLPPVAHMDTRQLAKRHFSLIGNKLDDLAEALGTTKKIENGGWDLWVKSHKRDPAALNLMAKYCKGDVLALDQIAKRLLAYDSHLPNKNLFFEEGNRCPRCGSLSVQKRGIETTRTTTYHRLFCNDCRGWSKIMPRQSSYKPLG